MPGGDGTGPLGRGSMTGRGLGLCAGNAIESLPRYGRAGFGRGINCRRNAFRNVPVQSDVSKEYLKDVETRLQSELDAIKKRIEEL